MRVTEDPDDLYFQLEEINSDLRWTEATLEVLEWVLGETDMRPEIMTKEELNEEVLNDRNSN